MYRTAVLLVAGLGCLGLAASGFLIDGLRLFAIPGLLLLVAAIASSYASDFLSGYRNAGGE